MEEKKMKAKSLGLNKPSAMTYEEQSAKLKEYETILSQNGAAYQQLEKAYKQAVNQLQQVRTQEIITRLEFSFKVLDHEVHFDPNFVKFCAGQITEILSPVEDKEDGDTEVSAEGPTEEQA